jgi:protein-disulfide isomerase
LALEYYKVGGKANYDTINAIQKEQVVEWLKQYEAQWGVIPEVDSYNEPQAAAQAISLEQAKKVTTEGTYILWNPDAEISFVEYSDLECPFCQRLHESWVIDQVLENYEGKVNFIFKHFPLPSHRNAQQKAEVTECAGELGWKDAYYEAVETIFSNGWDISELPGKLGIDIDKFQTCLNSSKYTDKVQSQAKEWKNLFGITWTPGNVLINNKTGEWDKLPWAYPYENFKQKIDALLQ